jgi:hypothetical protein
MDHWVSSSKIINRLKLSPKVCSIAGPNSGLFGGSIDGDEDEIGLLDSLIDIGIEE